MSTLFHATSLTTKKIDPSQKDIGYIFTRKKFLKKFKKHFFAPLIIRNRFIIVPIVESEVI